MEVLHQDHTMPGWCDPTYLKLRVDAGVANGVSEAWSWRSIVVVSVVAVTKLTRREVDGGFGSQPGGANGDGGDCGRGGGNGTTRSTR